MRLRSYFGMTALLLPAVAAFAAEVNYQHPNLTIVARNESLDSVLKSVSREMHIFVTTPSGLNPIVSCDIQSQPLEKAFKTLMGDMSYSLEWNSNGQQLVGLTILSGSAQPSAAAELGSSSVAVPVDRVSGMPGETYSAPSAGQQNQSDGERAFPATYSDAAVEPRDLGDDPNIQAEAPEAAARKLNEREIERELRRQEEVIAREAEMEEEEVRNQAEMAEYFKAYGISPNP